MERARLSAARHGKHWTLAEAAEHLGVDAASIQRWEKGFTAPQPINIRKLCDLYAMTAGELGLEETSVEIPLLLDTEERVDNTVTLFRTHDCTLRLMRIVWNWPSHTARYQELQALITQELEDNRMDPDHLLTRRDALRRLAVLPMEMSGLSALGVVLNHPVEEILVQCASAITACWHLRKGKELAFAADAIRCYLPTLKMIAKTAPVTQRKAAADLLAQSFLLTSILAKHTGESNTTALGYAQQAKYYSEIAENLVLQILAIRTQANAYDYADQWREAALAAEQAKFLLETARGTVAPPLVASYVYAGLANYQGHIGQKQDALHSLGKAHETFFLSLSDETGSVWIDHNQANLLLHDGLAHLYLGLYKEAGDAFTQIRQLSNPSTRETTRIEALFDQVLAEVQREDTQRDMEYCADCWTQGIHGAMTIQSQQRFDEAILAYTAMCAVWPGEQRIKDLRNAILHW